MYISCSFTLNKIKQSVCHVWRIMDPLALYKFGAGRLIKLFFNLVYMAMKFNKLYNHRVTACRLFAYDTMISIILMKSNIDYWYYVSQG